MATPSIFSLVDVEPSYLIDLQVVMLGGEVIPQTLVDKWAIHVRLYNVYGTTEATVYQFSQLCSTENKQLASIGYALPGIDSMLLPYDESLTGCNSFFFADSWLF